MTVLIAVICKFRMTIGLNYKRVITLIFKREITLVSENQ